AATADDRVGDERGPVDDLAHAGWRSGRLGQELRDHRAHCTTGIVGRGEALRHPDLSGGTALGHAVGEGAADVDGDADAPLRRGRRGGLVQGLDVVLLAAPAGRRLDQSTRAPEAWTTAAHLAISLSIWAANCSGVLPTISKPRGARRSWTSGLARAALMAALSLRIASGFVFAGATKPYHALASKPGTPDSATV